MLRLNFYRTSVPGLFMIFCLIFFEVSQCRFHVFDGEVNCFAMLSLRIIYKVRKCDVFFGIWYRRDIFWQLLAFSLSLSHKWFWECSFTCSISRLILRNFEQSVLPHRTKQSNGTKPFFWFFRKYIYQLVL